MVGDGVLLFADLVKAEQFTRTQALLLRTRKETIERKRLTLRPGLRRLDGMKLVMFINICVRTKLRQKSKEKLTGRSILHDPTEWLSSHYRHAPSRPQYPGAY
jgi:hypothetical protein